MKQSKIDQAIDPRVLDEAAEWLMRLNASDASEKDNIACESWRKLNPENTQAWARAELLLSKLGSLPPQLSMPALNRSKRNAPFNSSRRVVLGKLATLLAVIPAGWSGWQLAETQGLMADYRSATGEQRHIQLADGSHITLNTATAIDVQFDTNQRLIKLRSGEILIETAPDNALTARPFIVETAQGRMQALGTKFNVRQQGHHTKLAVLEGAVRIEPAKARQTMSRIIHAGEQTSFTASNIDAAKPLDSNITAWNHGMLVADKTRLADFAIELNRYRSGILRVAPEIAHLQVSGAYPIDDTNKALSMLASTYSLQTHMRLGGYWVTLMPC